MQLKKDAKEAFESFCQFLSGFLIYIYIYIYIYIVLSFKKSYKFCVQAAKMIKVKYLLIGSNSNFAVSLVLSRYRGLTGLE